MSKIVKTSLEYYKEPLKGLFGFKGGYLSELWQIKCTIETDSFLKGTGYGVQSVLWSDATIFQEYGQDVGNTLMYKITMRALEMLQGRTIIDPISIQEDILPDLLRYSRNITGKENLRTTFVLNALTPVDWALWKLWREELGNINFEELTGLSANKRQSELGCIPLISYDTELDRVKELAEEGAFLFKIKIGANPGGRNDPEEVVIQDTRRLLEIHRLLSDYSTPHTNCGHPVYYLDANGRYDTVERVLRLLDNADKIGALERIMLLEEPFPENALLPVNELPILVAGDESAHGEQEVIRLIEEYGFGAISLKPIAKTLSISLRVLHAAEERNVPCFCADLTVNPKMVEMNKLFAAHLDPIPGLKTGVVEANGSQNYVNWDKMIISSGLESAPWAHLDKGVFTLSDNYYLLDGNIWKD